jgi:holo-[acyl-carrier protein] synthase
LQDKKTLARIAMITLISSHRKTRERKNMIIGIGVDMVDCNRFLDWSAFKKSRIFTKQELEFADKDNVNSERHLANFWAAREACLKAMGCGFGENINFSDVSVIHNENGAPELLISGGARAELKTLAGADARVFVSITDQGEYCVAMVVIEKVEK